MSQNDERKAQRMSALLAICIITGILVTLPIAGGFADWINATNAPTGSEDRYEEITQQTGVTYDIDSTQFKSTTGYRSYYVWKNTTGDLNYNNVTHTSGVVSVQDLSLTKDAFTNISYSSMAPYYEIYLDYTAKQAYADNVVKIEFNLTGFTSVSTFSRSVTIEAGGVTFFSYSKANDDSESIVAEDIEIDTNDLRRAVIGGGENSYFVITIKGVSQTGLSIANSHVQAYKVTKLSQRDDGLLIGSCITVGIIAIGIILVQPKYNLPIGLSGGSNKPGRF